MTPQRSVYYECDCVLTGVIVSALNYSLQFASEADFVCASMAAAATLLNAMPQSVRTAKNRPLNARSFSSERLHTPLVESIVDPMRFHA